jgi:NTE family protein
MIAFVLSGGGSHGAMQAGALIALAERGIRPDMVIGTSAGAINGSMVAYDSSLENVTRLAELWCELSSGVIYPGSYAAAIWHLASGEAGLFSNKGLKAFLQDHAPGDEQTFGDITAAQFYAVATEIPSGKLRIFGENKDEKVLDALMASTALPPLHPPYQIDDKFYVDGSLATKLPLEIAIEKGASIIYALHLHQDPADKPYVRNLISVAQWSITKLMYNQDEAELRWARKKTRLKLHHIQLVSELPLPITDFDHSNELIDTGHRQTVDYLDGLPTPLTTRLNEYVNNLQKRLSKAFQQLANIGRRTIFSQIAKNMIDSSDTKLP